MKVIITIVLFYGCRVYYMGLGHGLLTGIGTHVWAIQLI